MLGYTSDSRLCKLDLAKSSIAAMKMLLEASSFKDFVYFRADAYTTALEVTMVTATLMVATTVLIGMYTCHRSMGLLIRIVQVMQERPAQKREMAEMHVQESPRQRLPTSVIEVFSSPRTTRVSTLALRRAGARRLCGVRKCTKVTYNPASHGDCGYQVLIRAARKRVSKKSIAVLREEVAKSFSMHHENNSLVAGILLSDLVIKEGYKSVEDYTWHIRNGQWASYVELSIAASILHVPLAYKACGVVRTLFPGQTNQMVVMIGEHYVLKKGPRRQLDHDEVTYTSSTWKRAGMQRSRSPRRRELANQTQGAITPTQTFVGSEHNGEIEPFDDIYQGIAEGNEQEDQNYDFEGEEYEWDGRQMRLVRERSRSRDSQRSTHSNDPSCVSIPTTPREYPPAQTPRTPRPAFCPDRERPAWVRAHPDASSWNVMLDIRRLHNLDRMPRFQPVAALRWGDVHYLDLPRMHIMPPHPTAVDLRSNLWEKLAPIRHVPLFDGYDCQQVFALAQQTEAEEVIYRIQNYVNPEPPFEIVLAISVESNWIAKYQRVPRAGMRPARSPSCVSISSTEEENTKVVIGTIPPMPAREVTVKIPSQYEEYQMIEFLATKYEVPAQKVRVLNAMPTTQYRAMAGVNEIIGRAYEVATMRTEAQHGGGDRSSGHASMAATEERYRCWWRWSDQKIEQPSLICDFTADIKVADFVQQITHDRQLRAIDVVVEYLGVIVPVYKNLAAYCNGTLVLHHRSAYASTPGPWERPHMFRAGAKGGAKDRDPMTNHKAEMQKWALDRLQEHVPTIPFKTARYLVRSEGRLSSALMNSKSAVQSTHIVLAALKRAGLDSMVRDLESHMKEAPRRRQPNNQHSQQQQETESPVEQTHPESTQQNQPPILVL